MTTSTQTATAVTIRRARREDVERIAELIMLGAATQTMTADEIAAEAAERYLDYYAVEHADGPSLDAWSAGIGAQTKILSSPEAVRAFRKRFAAGAGGSALVGTAEDIAARLAVLSEAGLDGVLLIWVDFVDGLRRFTADVLPLLEKRGLRSPVA